MIQKTWVLCGVALTLGALSNGCTSGGVGDPCTPEDEYQQYFSGYAVAEVNVESKSFQCETRLCLVNHFLGRVSCPYGQSESAGNWTGDPGDSVDTNDQTGRYKREQGFCHLPGTTSASNRIKAAVNAQYETRRPNDAVYCSCRCAGPDSSARYCECPSGFSCVELLKPNSELNKITTGSQLAGSYCIKSGTDYISSSVQTVCTVKDATSNTPGSCGTWDGSL